jgi:hypothetical protein
VEVIRERQRGGEWEDCLEESVLKKLSPLPGIIILSPMTILLVNAHKHHQFSMRGGHEFTPLQTITTAFLHPDLWARSLSRSSS